MTLSQIVSHKTPQIVLSAYLHPTVSAAMTSNSTLIKALESQMTEKYPNVQIAAKRTLNGNSESLDLDMKMAAIPGEDKLMFAKEAFFSWGITLDVKPRISPDGLISVEIIPTISQLDTDFTMKDGATAVIGGLSKTTEEDIDSGIPYLRNIPYVGPKLFGWKSRGKVQKEIVVFVTLGIADPADLPADAGLPKNAVTGREYVEGRKLEPGDRAGGVANLMAFDTRPIEEQRKDDHHAPGSVTITPVQKVIPGKKAESATESVEVPGQSNESVKKEVEK